MGLKLIAGPAIEPITLAEARLHLRLDDDGDSPAAHPDDPWLATVGIPAARQYCEGWTERALAVQTLELALDAFPTAEIELARPPLIAIDSIIYVDANSTPQTISAANYVVDTYQEPGWVLPATTYVWPATAAVINAVKIRYSAGYDLPGDSPSVNPLPEAIKAAMLLVLGHLYEHREQASALRLEDLPLGVSHLLRPYQIRQSMA